MCKNCKFCKIHQEEIPETPVYGGVFPARQVVNYYCNRYPKQMAVNKNHQCGEFKERKSSLL